MNRPNISTIVLFQIAIVTLAYFITKLVRLDALDAGGMDYTGDFPVIAIFIIIMALQGLNMHFAYMWAHSLIWRKTDG